jgi:signal transduction histidine kinase
MSSDEKKSLPKDPLSSDLLDTSKLSSTGIKVAQLKSRIIDAWGKELRRSIPRAKNLSVPILTDNIPAFINNLAEAISPEYPRVLATDTSTSAEAHGSERARLTDYNIEALLKEYQTFRHCLFDVLEESQVALTEFERKVINASIDEGMRQAVVGFSQVQNTIREHFMATLTHDLKNPLNAANMAAQLIQWKPSDPGVALHAEKIIKNHKRIEKMINDLLDSITLKARGRLHLNISLCDIHSIVSEVIHAFELQFEKRLTLKGGSIEGYWDPDALKRAVENLISNALKYGDPETQVSIGLSTLNGRLILRVHNMGPPIPIELQTTIFQIFRRVSQVNGPRREGWGLGLALVRGVCESHGGILSLDSSLERGTTFTIDIPTDARPFQE